MTWSLILRKFSSFPPVNWTWKGSRTECGQLLVSTSEANCVPGHDPTFPLPHLPRDSLGSIVLGWLWPEAVSPVTLPSRFSGVLCFKERCRPQCCSRYRWRWWVSRPRGSRTLTLLWPGQFLEKASLEAFIHAGPPVVEVLHRMIFLPTTYVACSLVSLRSLLVSPPRGIPWPAYQNEQPLPLFNSSALLFFRVLTTHSQTWLYL